MSKILLVEDDENLAFLCSRCSLEQARYMVDHVAAGLIALSQLKMAEYDLLDSGLDVAWIFPASTYAVNTEAQEWTHTDFDADRSRCCGRSKRQRFKCRSRRLSGQTISSCRAQCQGASAFTQANVSYAGKTLQVKDIELDTEGQPCF